MGWWWFEETVETFKGFNISDLGIDEAWLNISSDGALPQKLWAYVLSSNCDECSFQRLSEKPLLPSNALKTRISSQYESTIRIRTSGNSIYTPYQNDSFTVCELRHKYGEFGVYSIYVKGKEQSTSAAAECNLETDLDPVNVFLPLAAVLFFWLFACFLWLNGSQIIKALSRKWGSSIGEEERIQSSSENETLTRQSSTSNSSTGSGEIDTIAERVKKKLNTRKTLRRNEGAATTTNSSDKSQQQQQQPSSSSSSSSPKSSSKPLRQSSVSQDESQPQSQSLKERLKSLDTFRGLCIIIMIFADDGGAGYTFFQHCNWDGLYFADLAFPWFLWICGVCIPFSLHSKIRSGSPKLTITNELLKRSLKLVLLGIMVNTSTKATPIQLEYLRFPGVLQRFGICYFLGSILFLFFCGESIITETPHRRRKLEDLRITVLPWIFVLSCVALHTSIIFFLPVPNCPRGYLGPGGLHRNSSFAPECVGGASGYIDRLIFGLSHIHNYPTSRKTYGSGPFDPEGILGLLPSIFQIWLGVHTGIILLLFKNWKERLFRLIFWSIFCGIIGLVICGGLGNRGWIPINKNLWSLSFVLVTSAAANLMLSLVYYVIDVRNVWRGSPFMEAGMNSIFLYLAHEVCHAVFPWHYSYGKMRTHFSRLIESSWGTFLWIVVGVQLHKRKLFFVV